MGQGEGLQVTPPDAPTPPRGGHCWCSVSDHPPWEGQRRPLPAAPTGGCSSPLPTAPGGLDTNILMPKGEGEGQTPHRALTDAEPEFPVQRNHLKKEPHRPFCKLVGKTFTDRAQQPRRKRQLRPGDEHVGARECVLSRVRLLRPHGLQPTRFLRPWDFPGKSIGVGCHLVLQGTLPTPKSNLGLLCLLHWQAGLHQSASPPNPPQTPTGGVGRAAPGSTVT